jgi:hypothetical protein
LWQSRFLKSPAIYKFNVLPLTMVYDNDLAPDYHACPLFLLNKNSKLVVFHDILMILGICICNCFLLHSAMNQRLPTNKK